MRFEAGMLVPMQGAAAGCCFRVLLSKRCVCFGFGAGLLVPLQGAGAGYYCQRAVCILGTWVLLHGIAVRTQCAL